MIADDDEGAAGPEEPRRFAIGGPEVPEMFIREAHRRDVVFRARQTGRRNIGVDQSVIDRLRPR